MSNNFDYADIVTDSNHGQEDYKNMVTDVQDNSRGNVYDKFCCEDLMVEKDKLKFAMKDRHLGFDVKEPKVMFVFKVLI